MDPESSWLSLEDVDISYNGLPERDDILSGQVSGRISISSSFDNTQENAECNLPESKIRSSLGLGAYSLLSPRNKFLEDL